MPPLRLLYYASPLGRGLDKPTGVGQHITHTLRELGARDDLSLVLASSRAEYRGLPAEAAEEVATIPRQLFRGPERLMRALLTGTRLVALDRLCGPADWVYVPREQPVWVRRARLAVTVHDVAPLEAPGVAHTGLSRSSRRRWRFHLDRIAERADLVFCGSAFSRGRLQALHGGIEASRLIVSGYGVAPAFFRTREDDARPLLSAHGLETERFVVVPASLTYRKGADRVLDFAHLATRALPGLRVVVTGRRHEPAYLGQAEQAGLLGTNTSLHLPGYLPQEELAVLMSHALAVLFPSRYEGFGIPVLEAMAAGAPVLCSDTAALPETAGGCACLVDDPAGEGLLEAMLELRRRPDHRDQLVQSGRQRAAGFTWPACVEKIVSAMKACPEAA